MQTKLLIAGGLLASFITGSLATAYFRPAATPGVTSIERTAGPTFTRSDMESPVVVNCPDGRVVVTSFGSSGRPQLNFDCVRDNFRDPRYSNFRDVYNPTAQTTLISDVETVPLVQRRTAPRVERVVERQYVERERPRVQRRRSWEREALIIAGSAGAGTAIGALAGGKKGAGIGALTGGIAGLVYDLTTRNR